ncbi:BMP family ABC transporter substrate-binding protein [Gracilibacillus caseinilyticus]|uniref:BMP family ABC transporter substrate-binding protein n=1 Tax=Gracilibacillus caseinilyticus TaxID=2932256 RepID=A0ABY4ER54_9BACI|nr:BMP family ABC transporter substrate-binding protein [Gracilibacillus caseinilyticus]UOQ46915.1 BMP family ABC transporter substrate-binding protein [Gracilibacillus caseinilyticus]
MKKFIVMLSSIICMISFLSGCQSGGNGEKIERVGMLIEHTVHDQTWGNKGYRGLLNIQEEYDTDVYFQEGVQTQQQVNVAVEEFASKGVQVIIGHSSNYGEMFNQIHASYPDIQFIYVNGGYSADNLISLNFNAQAMGFFAGMIAGEMTETNRVGIIAAYEWQPEVEGYYEGVLYKNPDANVDIQYVYDWDEQELAMEHYQAMRDQKTDVIYPAGDAFSVSVVEAAKNDGIFSIGYVNDQQPAGGSSVLTSTIQHIDKLYVYAIGQLKDGDLPGGIYNFGFDEDVITMGPYSKQVPERFVDQVSESINEYKETGLLPHQTEK